MSGIALIGSGKGTALREVPSKKERGSIFRRLIRRSVGRLITG